MPEIEAAKPKPQKPDPPKPPSVSRMPTRSSTGLAAKKGSSSNSIIPEAPQEPEKADDMDLEAGEEEAPPSVFTRDSFASVTKRQKVEAKLPEPIKINCTHDVQFIDFDSLNTQATARVEDDKTVFLPKNWVASLGKFSNYLTNGLSAAELTVVESSNELGSNSAEAFLKEPNATNFASMSHLRDGKIARAVIQFQDYFSQIFDIKAQGSRASPDTIGRSAQQRSQAIAAQLLLFPGTSKKTLDATTKTTLAAENSFRDLLLEIFPEGKIAISELFAACRKINRKIIKSQLADKKTAGATQLLLQTYYAPMSTLVERAYPVSNKRRLKKKFKLTPEHRRRDHMYENYTSTCRPHIEKSKYNLSSSESDLIDLINMDCQNLSKFVEDLDNIDQTSRIAHARLVIASVQKRISALRKYLSSKKSLAHSAMVSKRREENRESKDAFLPSDWAEAYQAVNSKSELFAKAKGFFIELDDNQMYRSSLSKSVNVLKE